MSIDHSSYSSYFDFLSTVAFLRSNKQGRFGVVYSKEFFDSANTSSSLYGILLLLIC
jgi:hypothetical protein